MSTWTAQAALALLAASVFTVGCRPRPGNATDTAGDAPAPPPAVSMAPGDSMSTVPGDRAPDEVVAVRGDSVGRETTARDSASRQAPSRDTVTRDTLVPSRPSSRLRAPQRLAMIQFVDSIGEADLAWLRGEGLEIVHREPGSSTAVVRLPASYARDPSRLNPRVRRFQVQMR